MDEHNGIYDSLATVADSMGTKNENGYDDNTSQSGIWIPETGEVKLTLCDEDPYEVRP